MVDIISSEAGIPRPDHPLDSSGSAKWFLPAFGVLVLVGVVYVGYALSQDLAVAKTVPWILLGIALLIALGAAAAPISRAFDPLFSAILKTSPGPV